MNDCFSLSLPASPLFKINQYIKIKKILNEWGESEADLDVHFCVLGEWVKGTWGSLMYTGGGAEGLLQMILSMTLLSYWGSFLPPSPSVVPDTPLGTAEQQLTLSVGQPPLWLAHGGTCQGWWHARGGDTDSFPVRAGTGAREHGGGLPFCEMWHSCSISYQTNLG